MWTLWSTTLFNFVYSICVKILYNSECAPQRISLTLDSVFKLFDRVVAYVIWFYPVIYLFWPTKRNIHQEERYVKVANQVKDP